LKRRVLLQGTVRSLSNVKKPHHLLFFRVMIFSKELPIQGFKNTFKIFFDESVKISLKYSSHPSRNLTKISNIDLDLAKISAIVKS